MVGLYQNKGRRSINRWDCSRFVLVENLVPKFKRGPPNFLTWISEIWVSEVNTRPKKNVKSLLASGMQGESHFVHSFLNQI